MSGCRMRLLLVWLQAGAVLDEVMGYTGMRKFSLNTTSNSPDAPLRIFLNNQPFIGFGVLDQVCFLPSRMHAALLYYCTPSSVLLECSVAAHQPSTC